MAVKKKTPTRRRKPGAKAPGRKRKPRVGGTAAAVGKIKIAGATFAKESCHTSKTAAQKQADRIRAQGNKARVIKSGSAMCVYKGGKISPKAPLHLRRRRAA